MYNSSLLHEGQFVSSFGTKGSEPGQLYCPTGITLDDNDLVYVNNGNQFISVYTTDRQYITRIEKSQTDNPTYPSKPLIVTFDTNGDLYVSHPEFNKVEVF